MRERRIGIIYTGGTIGMTRTPTGFAPEAGFAARVRKMLSGEPALPPHTVIEYATPIDSANATPADWRALAQEIMQREQDYDGFVVLHGTDTMAFTASALSFMLQGLDKPVVLTGSQIPLAAVRSDAMPNLIGAMQLAADARWAEVGIYFHQRLLRGNRSTKISAFSLQAFDSPNYPPLAVAGIGYEWNEGVLLPRTHRKPLALHQPDRTPTVLSVRFAPGLPTQALKNQLQCRPDGLILECYGAGNAPDSDPVLLQVLEQASRAGTVVVARSQCPHGRVAIGTYAAGAGLAGAGVIGMGDMSFEAAYTKLHYLLASGLAPDAVRTAMRASLAGELTPD